MTLETGQQVRETIRSLLSAPSGVVNFVSLTDLRVMDVIGWQVAETAPVVTALTATVGEDGPTLSQGLLTGAVGRRQ